MKYTSIIIVLCFVLPVANLVGQNDRYVESMKSAMENIGFSKPEAELLQTANQFERIANVETDKWMPPYYGALCYIILATKDMQGDGEKIDDYVDKAEVLVEKAVAIAPENSEVITLQGYVLMANIWSNPMINGAMYGPKAISQFDAAIKANPDNPRPYSLKAQNLYYTPAMFGGGPESARPFLDMANEKYESFEPESELAPTWGKETNDYFLAMYDEDDEE